jgi:hypothetical protein
MIVTHPGRFGDLLWALPTVRALAKVHGPVDLHLPVDPANTTPMVDIAPLLRLQPYIRAVIVRQDWSIEQDAPRRPTEPPDTDGVHLGYPEWPTAPLPFYSAMLGGFHPADVDFSPWITVNHPAPPIPICCMWTDRWFELKFGLTKLLNRRPLPAMWYGTSGGSRFQSEAGWIPTTILNLAERFASADVVLTDCSMAHVLAAGLGKTVVVVEPETARHHWVFWPGAYINANTGHWRQGYHLFGRLIFPVIGGDGKPTFDARHTFDAIQERLR